jgi:ATP-dependent Clp protease ATP-binding subunit ClpB
MRARVNEALRANFRPELLNRIDEMVIFKQLTREQLRDIVDLQLKRLTQRLEERHIKLEVTDQAKDLLAREGFDPVYGARPLKRVIQRRLLDPLALEIIGGTVHDGETVVADVEGDKIRFTVPATADAAANTPAAS